MKIYSYNDKTVWFTYSNEFRLEYGNLMDLCRSAAPQQLMPELVRMGWNGFFLRRIPITHVPGSTGFMDGGSLLKIAAEKGNLPVVKLLLELGASPDIMCDRVASENKVSVREYFADKPEIHQLFPVKKYWWQEQYPPSRCAELRNELERSVRENNPVDIFWYVMHGVRLDSPALLLSESFGQLPAAVQAFICCFGVPEECRAEFLAAVTDGTPELQDFLQNRETEAREVLEKLRFSRELICEETQDELIRQGFAAHQQFWMLKLLVNGIWDIEEDEKFFDKVMDALWFAVLSRSIPASQPVNQ